MQPSLLYDKLQIIDIERFYNINCGIAVRPACLCLVIYTQLNLSWLISLYGDKQS